MRCIRIKITKDQNVTIRQFVSGMIESHPDEDLRHHDANYIAAAASHRYNATGRYLKYPAEWPTDHPDALRSMRLSNGQIQAVYCSLLTVLINGKEIIYPGQKQLPKSADQILKEIYQNPKTPPQNTRLSKHDIMALTSKEISDAEVIYEHMGNLFSSGKQEIPISKNIYSLSKLDLNIITLRADSWVVAGGWWKAPAIYAALVKSDKPTCNCLVIDSEIAKLLVKWL